MEKIKDLSGWSVKQWEVAVDKLDGVMLEEVRLNRRKVVGATGVVTLTSGHDIAVNWLWDGRAFILGKRALQYDLKFE